MTNEKISKLLKDIEASGIPRSMWPRIEEREKYRQMRIDQKENDDLVIIIAALKKTDEIEKEKSREFSKWLIFLLFLMDDDEKNCTSFFHSAYRKMWDRQSTPPLLLGSGAIIENSFVCIAALKFKEKEVIESMNYGIPAFEDCTRFKRGKVTSTIPMQNAIQNLKGEMAKIEREKMTNELDANPSPNF